MKNLLLAALCILAFSTVEIMAQTPYTMRGKTILLTLSPTGRVTEIAAADGSWKQPLSGYNALEGCTEQADVTAKPFGEGGIEFVKSVVSDSTGARCTIVERFAPDSTSIRWEVEIEGDTRPGTTGISTILKIADNAGARFWTTWGDPGHLSAAERGSEDPEIWQSPFEARPFREMHLVYGGHFAKAGGYSIPHVSVMSPEDNAGLSLLMSPEDPLLDMHLFTGRDGSIRQTRFNHRLEKGRPLRFTMHFFLHDTDWRSVMAFVVARYPHFFFPLAEHALDLSALGTYSGHEGEIDVAKYRAMGGIINWKASFDFPYMGLFLPPVPTDTTRWKRFDVTSEGEWIPGRQTYTTIGQMSDYASRMKRIGFPTLNYFNVTEFGGASRFGKEVAYPRPEFSPDESHWTNPSAFVYLNFPGAILFGSHDRIGWHKLTPQQFMLPQVKFQARPSYTWGGAIATDMGDSAYAAFLLDQARRHVDKLPDAGGICLDRIDWFNEYNWRADDGQSWIQDRPVRSLLNSARDFIPRLADVMHGAGKVLFCNPEMNRLDMMRHFDGIFNEFGYLSYNLNQSAFLTFFKPLICWTPKKETVLKRPDHYFQKHLVMGAFPMAPFPGNDHSIAPDPEVERYYLDYGPLLSALRGRMWLLLPGVIGVEKGEAQANVFAVGNTVVIPVVMGNDGEPVSVRLRRCGQLLGTRAVDVETWHPGRNAPERHRAAVRQDELVLDVPLQRGCALLVLKPAEGNVR